MATDRLKIYNGALLLCEQRSLASLTVNEEARRALDEVWNDGGVRWCLEQGQWKFAMRTVRLDYDPAIDPEFGYRRAFAKPDDWVLTSALCSDERFNVPITAYHFEAGYWYCDLDEIYLRYVSDDTAFGLNYSAWPATFTEFVKAYFALRIVRRLPSGGDKFQFVERVFAKNMAIAKNKDAMAEGPRFAAQGNWTRNRQGAGGRRGPMGDGGGSGSLTG